VVIGSHPVLKQLHLPICSLGRWRATFRPAQPSILRPSVSQLPLNTIYPGGASSSKNGNHLCSNYARTCLPVLGISSIYE
jgi:hypothetical protein